MTEINYPLSIKTNTVIPLRASLYLTFETQTAPFSKVLLSVM